MRPHYLLENKTKQNNNITIYTTHDLNKTNIGLCLLHRLTNRFSWKDDYAGLLFSFSLPCHYWSHAITIWIVPSSCQIFERFGSYPDCKQASFQAFNVVSITSFKKLWEFSYMYTDFKG